MSRFKRNLNIKSKKAKELFRILSAKRPHNSNSEAELGKYLMDEFQGMYQDKFGNCILKLYGNKTRVCFSSHLDTVHRSEGQQELIIDTDLGMIYKQDSECLGADDGTGVWIMMQMIDAGVEGLYIFHRAEEVGGQGSSWIVKNTPELLDDIDICIAFDRKDYESIITHQRGKRCCSEDFVASLAAQLEPMKFKADTTGSFTDSANYTELVPECTNLSVGYFRQHTSSEHQDMGFLVQLVRALTLIDWNKVVNKRSTEIVRDLTYIEIVNIIRDEPDVVAELLADIGISTQDVEDAKIMLDAQYKGIGIGPWDHLL